jgi:hypothetical protein
LLTVRCFSANSTSFSSTARPFFRRTSFMYLRAMFSESAWSRFYEISFVRKLRAKLQSGWIIS